MQKVYYELTMTNRETISLEQDQYRPIESLIMAKSDERIKAGDRIFVARDVRYVKKVYPPEYQLAEASRGPLIPDAEREANLIRWTVLKAWFAEKKNGEDIANPYGSDDIRAHMTRAERQAFNAEFFDVLFHDDAARRRALAYWLAYSRGQRDPRNYHPDAVNAASRGQVTG